MKIALSLLAVVVLASGCSTTNVTKLTEAISKDPAAVAVDIMTPYGSAKVRRAGCLPGQTTTINSDGSMTVSNGGTGTNFLTAPVKATLSVQPQ